MTRSETTSPSLLSRVRDPADVAAWLEFDARYGELIVRYCRRMGLRHFDAEDLRQIVMMKLAKALRSFRYAPQRGRFRTYLGRVVRNEVIRHWGRPNGVDPAVDDPGGAAPQRAAPEPMDVSREIDESWEHEWKFHHLRMAMKCIRRTHANRSVEVFERLLSGEPVHRVADSFGITTQAVHKIKQRIRERLRQIVAVQIRDEDEPHG